MDKSFITVTPDTGRNNGTLSVKADANEDYVRRRSATFKVEGGGITKSVSIEQDRNRYIYIDCGYIFSVANIQEPYESVSDGTFPSLRFDVKFANFILSSSSRFIIKNISSLIFIFNNNCVISRMTFSANNQYFGEITLEEFTTELVPNSENEDMTLSIIDITPAKINEIVGKINSVHDASTTGAMAINIIIKTTGEYENLVIQINVI